MLFAGGKTIPSIALPVEPLGGQRRDNLHLLDARVRKEFRFAKQQFAAGVAASGRVRSAAESLRDSAEVRVTAEQSANGEWVASDIVILKLPKIDKIRLRI